MTPKCRQERVQMNFRRLVVIINTVIVILLIFMAGAYLILRPDGSENQKEHSILIGASYMTMNNELFAIINVGYPTGDSKPSSMHGVRKPMGEFMSMIE